MSYPFWLVVLKLEAGNVASWRPDRHSMARVFPDRKIPYCSWLQWKQATRSKTVVVSRPASVRYVTLLKVTYLLRLSW